MISLRSENGPGDEDKVSQIKAITMAGVSTAILVQFHALFVNFQELEVELEVYTSWLFGCTAAPPLLCSCSTRLDGG